MSLKDQFAKDAKNVFLNPDDGAELIIYTPFGGTPKPIYANVIRQRVTPATENSGRVLIKEFEIGIANDADAGVTTIKEGQDVASLPEVIGGANVDFIVAGILGQDKGMWHLVLQK